jgi:hypothetical protein
VVLDTAKSQLLPGLDREKKISQTYWHVDIILNLKFYPDRSKNNEEKAFIADLPIINKKMHFFFIKYFFSVTVTVTVMVTVTVTVTVLLQ